MNGKAGWGVSTADFFKLMGDEPICFHLRDGKRIKGHLVGVDDRALIIEQRDRGKPVTVLVTWHAISRIEPRIYTDSLHADKTPAHLAGRAGKMHRRSAG